MWGDAICRAAIEATTRLTGHIMFNIISNENSHQTPWNGGKSQFGQKQVRTVRWQVWFSLKICGTSREGEVTLLPHDGSRLMSRMIWGRSVRSQSKTSSGKLMTMSAFGSFSMGILKLSHLGKWRCTLLQMYRRLSRMEEGISITEKNYYKCFRIYWVTTL